MSEWKETTLGELINFTTGKLNSNAAVIHGEYPFFTCSPETLNIDTYAFDTTPTPTNWKSSAKGC